jgi:uncharacterized protein (TIGR02246 family)
MEHAIRQAADAFAEALRNGNPAAAAALYAADGRLLTAAAELISGRREIESYWEAGIRIGLSRIDLEARDLQVVGGLAIEVGRYTLALGSVTDRGKYLVLHRRQPDGSWRRAVEVFNPDATEPVRPERKETR